MNELQAGAHDTGLCLVMTTVAQEAEAAALAEAIVQARLGACVQVQEIRSFYVWNDQPQAQGEWLLSVKTRREVYAALEAFIREHHRYETPEIVQLPITAGAAGYLDWVRQQTG